MAGDTDPALVVVRLDVATFIGQVLRLGGVQDHTQATSGWAVLCITVEGARFVFPLPVDLAGFGVGNVVQVDAGPPIAECEEQTVEAVTLEGFRGHGEAGPGRCLGAVGTLGNLLRLVGHFIPEQFAGPDILLGFKAPDAPPVSFAHFRRNGVEADGAHRGPCLLAVGGHESPPHVRALPWKTLYAASCSS